MYHTYRGYRFTSSLSGMMQENQYQELINILEQSKPSRICELGCGQSTIIFEQYCDKYKSTLYSIENDEMYFHKNAVLMPVIENTHVMIGDILYGDCNKYDGLESWLQSQSPFDFVMIDGPMGCGFRENYKYGRVQLLSFAVLDKLSASASVLMHDAERKNTIATLTEFERILNDSSKRFNKKCVASLTPNSHSLLTTYQLIGDNQ